MYCSSAHIDYARRSLDIFKLSAKCGDIETDILHEAFESTEMLVRISLDLGKDRLNANLLFNFRNIIYSNDELILQLPP